MQSENGIIGGVDVSFAILMTMGAFFTISLYNVIELNIIIFSTFKKRSGLYFWSFIAGTWGIAPHAIGFILKFFNVVDNAIWPLPVTLIGVGFIAMVTGQSLVLYSRLHLVVRATTKIRWVLYMIIFNAVVIYAPLMALAYCVNSPNPDPYLQPFTILDKVQIAIFFFQEALISIIYMYETFQLLGSGAQVNQKPLRNLLAHLLLVNLVVLVLDIALLSIQYAGDYNIQVAYKGASYSVKLKIEFAVLNKLVDLVKNKHLTSGNQRSQSYVLGTVTGSKSTQSDVMNSASHNADMNMDGSGIQPKDGPQRRVQTTETESVVELVPGSSSGQQQVRGASTWKERFAEIGFGRT